MFYMNPEEGPRIAFGTVILFLLLFIRKTHTFHYGGMVNIFYIQTLRHGVQDKGQILLYITILIRRVSLRGTDTFRSQYNIPWTNPEFLYKGVCGILQYVMKTSSA